CGPGLPDEIQGAMFGVNGDDGDEDEDREEEGWLINANEYYEEDPEEMEAEEDEEDELDGAGKSIPAPVQDEGWLINANEYYEEDPEELEAEEDIEEGELQGARKSIPAPVQDGEWEDPNDETILDPVVIREGFAAMYRIRYWALVSVFGSGLGFRYSVLGSGFGISFSLGIGLVSLESSL
ncbi:hypothetical protein H0H92_007773, partial [Tricholoma furcatifolium]